MAHENVVFRFGLATRLAISFRQGEYMEATSYGFTEISGNIPNIHCHRAPFLYFLQINYHYLGFGQGFVQISLNLCINYTTAAIPPSVLLLPVGKYSDRQL